MIAETLMIFLTTIMSMNQPVEINKSSLSEVKQQTEVKQANTETTPALLRGGWDRN
ncbi:MAG: hypothetical protein IPI23_21340 [Bacteroidetes bacterium]|nr:hypothetical protein [Bacteroidota bacterium]MBK7391520.1 hypothetical protein [Bacteroidota bacterium]MBK8413071.1 hypothetical protein [Bacteroidota bacterium]